MAVAKITAADALSRSRRRASASVATSIVRIKMPSA